MRRAQGTLQRTWALETKPVELVALRKRQRILEIRRLELRKHAGTFQLTWLQRKEHELTASSGSAGSSPPRAFAAVPGGPCPEVGRHKVVCSLL